MRFLKNRILGLALYFLCFSSPQANDTILSLDHDPHYTPAGFFDVHVCNWPDRPPFYLALFSTTQFEKLVSVTLLDAHGTVVGTFNMGRYQTANTAGKPEKRVYLTHFPIPPDKKDGWFIAKIKMVDGQHFEARDFIVHATMPIAQDPVPTAGAELDHPPSELSWKPIAGAKYYKVTIRDEWNAEQVVFSSTALTQPRVELPAGVLKAGGSYKWRIHARDVDGSPLLGDFNHGSLTAPISLSISQ